VVVVSEKLLIEVGAKAVAGDFDKIAADADKSFEKVGSAIDIAAVALERMAKSVEDVTLRLDRVAASGDAAAGALDRVGAAGAKPLEGLASATTEAAEGMFEVGRATGEATEFVGELDARSNEAARRIEAGFKEAEKAVGKVETELEGTAREATNLDGAVGGVVKSLGRLAAGAFALHKIAAFLREGAQMSRELDAELRGVGTRLGLNTDEAQRFRDALFDISQVKGVPIQDVAGGFSQAVEGGARTQNEAAQIVLPAIELSKTGVGTTAESIAALTAIIDAYQIETESATEISRLLFVTAVEGATDMKSLASGLSGVLPGIRAIGGGFKETLTLFIALRNSGLSTSKAFEAIGGFAKLAFTSEGRESAREYGQEIGKTRVEAEGLVPVFVDLSSTLSANEDALGRVVPKAGALGAGIADIGEKARAGTLALEDFADAAERLANAKPKDSSFGEARGRADALFAKFKANIGAQLEGAFVIASSVAFDIAKAFDIDLLGEGLSGSKGATEIEALTAKLKDATSEMERLAAARDSVAKGADEGILGVLFDKAPSAEKLAASDAAVAKASSVVAGLTQEISALESAGKLAAAEAQAALQAVRAERVAPLASGVPLQFILPEPTQIESEISKALAAFPDPVVPLSFEATPDSIKAAKARLEAFLETPRGARKDEQVEAVPRDLDSIVGFQRDRLQIEESIAAVEARSLTGLQRILSENEQLVRSAEARADSLGVETELTERLRAAAQRLRETGQQAFDDGQAKQQVDIQTRILTLRASSADKASELALAIGDVTTADARSAEAVELRSILAARAADREVADLRERLAGNDAALAKLDEYAAALRKAAGEEAALASAGRGRARQERVVRTTELVTQTQDSLVEGLDGELLAIERNRQAKVQAAQEAVRDRQIEAGALSTLLPLYDQIAARDAARASRDAAFGISSNIIDLVKQTSDAYTAQAEAIRLVGEAERERARESLALAGATQAETQATLDLLSKLEERQSIDLAVRFSDTSAVALAQQRLLDDAFRKSAREAELLGLSGQEAAQKIIDGMTEARGSVEGLTAGFGAGFEDFKRELADNVSFGERAAKDLGGTFRDSISGAIRGLSDEGESVFETFLKTNLEALEKQAADFAANQITLAIFGPPEGNDVGAPEQQLALASTTFDTAVSRFDLAVNRLAAGPGGSPAAGALGGFAPFAPSQDVDFPAFDGSGPTVPDGFDPGLAAGFGESVTEAGEAAGDAIKAGGSAASAAIVNGGNVFGSLIGGLASSLGSALSGELSSGITGALGFAEGGVVQGDLRPTYHHNRAQFGKVVRSRQLIEVAENPGLEEAIIPLKGGAVPVTIEHKGDPGAQRRRVTQDDRERDTAAPFGLDAQLMRAVLESPALAIPRGAKAGRSVPRGEEQPFDALAARLERGPLADALEPRGRRSARRAERDEKPTGLERLAASAQPVTRAKLEFPTLRTQRGARGARGTDGAEGSNGLGGLAAIAGLAGVGGRGGAGGRSARGGAGSQEPRGVDGIEGLLGLAGLSGIGGAGGRGGRGKRGGLGSEGPRGIDGLDGLAGPAALGGAGGRGGRGTRGGAGTAGVHGLDGLGGLGGPGGAGGQAGRGRRGSAGLAGPTGRSPDELLGSARGDRSSGRASEVTRGARLDAREQAGGEDAGGRSVSVNGGPITLNLSISMPGGGGGQSDRDHARLRADLKREVIDGVVAGLEGSNRKLINAVRQALP